MELEIINKKPIPMFVAATTPAVPLINNNVSAETDEGNGINRKNQQVY